MRRPTAPAAATVAHVPAVPEFDRCASLILDGIEEAFEIVAPGGRGEAHRAIVNILRYYTVPNPERVAERNQAVPHGE